MYPCLGTPALGFRALSIKWEYVFLEIDSKSQEDLYFQRFFQLNIWVQV